jgi:MoxR-like ATPase
MAENTSPASWNQCKVLKSITHIEIEPWQETGINVSQAGEIIALGFRYFGIKQQKDIQVKPLFEDAVRVFFPDFEAPARTIWLGGGRKKSNGGNGQEKKEEQEKPRSDQGQGDKDREEQQTPPPRQEQKQESGTGQEEHDSGREEEEREEKAKRDREKFEQKMREDDEKEQERRREEQARQDEKNRREEEEHQEKQDDYVPPEIYQEFLGLVKMGTNVLLTGPAGCGKSYMTERAAADLGLDYTCISLGGGMRYAQVIGSKEIVDGNTSWLPGPLIQAIQRPGLILLDEIFGCDPDVLLGLNSVTEPSSRRIVTPGGTFRVDPGVRFVAAANTTGRTVSRQYTGAQRSDDSVLSRFGMTLVMDYDRKVELSILRKMGLNGSGDNLVDLVEKLRDRVKINNIPFDPCTRRLIAAGRAIAEADFAVGRAFEIAFLNVLSPAERSKVGMQ